MTDKYIIELDGGSSVPTEVALTEFMSGVFDLAKKSNCINHGLTITKIEDHTGELYTEEQLYTNILGYKYPELKR